MGWIEMAIATLRSWTLAEIAARFDLSFQGEAQTTITGIATLNNASEHDLTFFANPLYREKLRDCRAAAVVMNADAARDYAQACLISAQPYLAFARIAAVCAQHCNAQASGIHASAVIAEDVQLSADVSIAAQVVIGSGCEIGAGSSIGAGTVLEPGVIVGDHCTIMARCWLGAGTRLGDRVRVHPGAVLGSDGFGLAWSGHGWEKVPQLGGLLISDDCEIGANTTIDRGSIDNTVLEADVRLDNQIQIAHNVHIGEHTAIAACTGIAGSTRIGQRCLIGGGCGIGGHLHIADDIELTGMSMVTRSLTQAGAYGSAIPAEPVRTWRRNMARLRNLDRLIRELMNGNKHA
ncbi:MAG: UDP-3-O-(3-hydroxymyristoyl)glucosamine N-acyltransferase [Gammaproteobacteria bacterium]|jgi:UDP-3-O-[3-hydroxymyristoyl] glucosamine N-acyltransferase|nr:UDP-3-O-(3-hydroxymyristoyl)glucosamine N-acyltransferase [Gammaproteobacteria bacterium]